MQRIGLVLMGMLVLQAGCGDDDNGDRLRDAMPSDALRDALEDALVDAPGETSFNVTLTPEQEVPVCDAASDTATGTAMVTIPADGQSVIVESVTWSNLSGDAIAAHIHSGAPGVAGPIVLDFGVNPTSPFMRTFTAADYPSPPPEGAPATFDAFVAQMRAGNSYVNVHTPMCQAGEIRGQLVP